MRLLAAATGFCSDAGLNTAPQNRQRTPADGSLAGFIMILLHCGHRMTCTFEQKLVRVEIPRMVWNRLLTHAKFVGCTSRRSTPPPSHPCGQRGSRASTIRLGYHNGNPNCSRPASHKSFCWRTLQIAASLPGGRCRPPATLIQPSSYFLCRRVNLRYGVVRSRQNGPSKSLCNTTPRVWLPHLTKPGLSIARIPTLHAFGIENPPNNGCYILLGCETTPQRNRTDCQTIVVGCTYCHLA